MESVRYTPRIISLVSDKSEQSPNAQEPLTAVFASGGWEVVYFVHPYCTGTCLHCWSADTFLGRRMPLKWHKKFWQHVSADRVREVRLTGGEPFENPDLGQIVDAVCTAVSPGKTVYIFTSGRSVVSRKTGLEGITETTDLLRQANVVKPGVEIHMSADEHHAGALYRYINGIRQLPVTFEEAMLHNEMGIPILLNMVHNFLSACELLAQETGSAFKGGKLKVHVGQGRGEFHRMEMYGANDDDWWDEYVIFSEGLICSGRARKQFGTLQIEPRDISSLFIIPGGKFCKVPKHRLAQRYRDLNTGQHFFLDAAKSDDNGACIIGFWNLVAKTFCGGSAIDALRLLGDPGAVDK